MVVLQHYAKHIISCSPTVIFFSTGFASYSALYLLDCLIHSKCSVTILFVALSFHSETAVGKIFKLYYFGPLVKTYRAYPSSKSDQTQKEIVHIFLLLPPHLFYSLGLY